MLLCTIFSALLVGLVGLIGLATAVPLSNDGFELLSVTLPPDYNVSGKQWLSDQFDLTHPLGPLTMK
jgi:hypothetical protein